MINLIFCIKDTINASLISSMLHIEELEEQIAKLKADGKEIPTSVIVDLCVTKSTVDELIRLRKLGL